MAIEGPLKELGLHDVFQLLDLSRKTGVLRITSDLRNNEGTVFFDRGAIVFATMPRQGAAHRGAAGPRGGKITPAELEHARAVQQREGGKRRLGKIFVEIGALTPRELEREVERQIEEVVFELLSWREGFFSFSEGRWTPRRPTRWCAAHREGADGGGAADRRMVAHRGAGAAPRRDPGAGAARGGGRRRGTDAGSPAGGMVGARGGGRRCATCGRSRRRCTFPSSTSRAPCSAW